MGTRRGRAVFTASSSIQYALEGGGPVPSAEAARVLPAVLVHRGAGGRTAHGRGRPGWRRYGRHVRTGDFVTDRVADLTTHQTPQLWLFGAHGGDVAIARSRPQVSMSTLSSELRFVSNCRSSAPCRGQGVGGAHRADDAGRTAPQVVPPTSVTMVPTPAVEPGGDAVCRWTSQWGTPKPSTDGRPRASSEPHGADVADGLGEGPDEFVFGVLAPHQGVGDGPHVGDGNEAHVGQHGPVEGDV